MLASALLLSGCASAANSAAMTWTTRAGIEPKAEASVAVSVTGGKGTNPMWSSNITSEDFAAALRSSIVATDLFKKVLAVEAADYRIDVLLVRSEKPIGGVSMSVSLTANWKLSRRSDGSVVWEKTIANQYTAPLKSALVGATRLRKALEGAARENIGLALRAISEAKLN